MHNIIIACDFKNATELYKFLEPFGNTTLFLKIGMELYYEEGKPLIRDLKARGHKIFLDLKLHDIPNTIAKTLETLKDLDVEYITIHAGGGEVMLTAAAAAIKNTNTKLLAVTILTSISEDMLKNELMITESLENVVTRYALMAYKAGIDGCICSPHEVPAIKHLLNDANFICITPGIRLTGDAIGDQIRVMTPKQAFDHGATKIVIGRSITNSDTPYQTYKKISTEI
ncbi:orotidine-5'-phosphate decarboxylase [Erysipelotrichaceae bacterium]|nr:orotidine-5'-phosphate decarboxylase [Erysipelotrichaceae bacterium]